MINEFSIAPENPESKDVILLLTALSENLASATGSSGEASFSFEDICVPRSLFVVARNENGEAVGCGAIRPISGEIAEVKRMYSKAKGAGKAILEFLEIRALEMNYEQLWLETRRVNEYAVNFYLARGYAPISNYGKYIDRPEAICLGKVLRK